MRRVVAAAVAATSLLLTAAAVVAWVDVLTGPEQPAAAALSYRPPAVQVSPGARADRAEVAAYVQKLTNDPRGWRRDLDEFTLRIVFPGQQGTQRMPGRIGQVDYSTRTAAVSDEAWNVVGERFAAAGGTLDDQRTWVVLHELGHLLGHHEHTECPGAGPAPIMRDTSYKLGGCSLNVWPNPVT